MRMFLKIQITEMSVRNWTFPVLRISSNAGDVNDAADTWWTFTLPKTSSKWQGT